jgi:hypothetical protein
VQDNPKRFSGGDFRAQRVAAEHIKRAQANQRNIAPENRIALREPSRNEQSVESRGGERVPSMRGQETRQNQVRSQARERPPVQALQGSPSESRSNQSGDNAIRRARERFEQRDAFQGGDTRRETREQPRAIREQPQVREQPQIQPRIREQPQIREQRQFREQPSESRREIREAPVERRASPPVERRASPQIEHREAPRVEQRSEPRAERQNSNQSSNRSSDQGSSRRESSGDGPRDRSSRRHD